MGLDAFVQCRCRTDGPPGACGHRNGVLVSQLINNWSGYRLFQEALATAGWEHFPTLRAELPETNDGTVPPAAADRILAELRYFTDHAELGTLPELLDETGEVINVGVPAHDWVFLLADPWRIGVDHRGLFVRDVGAGAAREVFRALRCTQRVVGSAPNGRNLVRLTDEDSGEPITVDAGPLGRGRTGPAPDPVSYPVTVDRGPPGTTRRPEPDRYPRTLRATTRALTAEDFRGTVDALTAVCRAAVRTGNPVIWC